MPLQRLGGVGEGIAMRENTPSPSHAFGAGPSLYREGRGVNFNSNEKLGYPFGDAGGFGFAFDLQ